MLDPPNTPKTSRDPFGVGVLARLGNLVRGGARQRAFFTYFGLTVTLGFGWIWSINVVKYLCSIYMLHGGFSVFPLNIKLRGSFSSDRNGFHHHRRISLFGLPWCYI